MPFKSFGLSDPLVRGILATGYTAPTEIQSKAIPAAIAGKDIIGCAQTGTGKTAAFVLPILNKLSHEGNTRKVVRALILTPTRELAVQIDECIGNYSRFLHLRTLAVYGGVSINNQLSALRKGVDIVVATPGRLMDHLNRNSVDFRNLETLVLDEADRMFDMGFINDVKKIISFLPKERQTLLFSATMSPEVKKLTHGIQKSPVMIQVGSERKPIETITQRIFPVKKDVKIDLLLYMLKNNSMYSVLVFSRTKHGADRINRRLQKADISATAIHSDKTQAQRQRALEGFKKGKFQVMIATDIAARGIDVSGITHVINYDVPNFAEDYVHRIGRTGRAAAEGEAITFVSPDETAHLRSIERFIERKFTMEKCEGFNYKKEEVLNPQEHDRPLRRDEQEEEPQRSFQRRGESKQYSHQSRDSRPPRHNKSQGGQHPRRNDTQSDESQRQPNRYGENKKYSHSNSSDRPQRYGSQQSSDRKSDDRKPYSRPNNDSRPQRPGGQYQSNDSRPQRSGGQYQSNDSRPKRPSQDSRPSGDKKSYGADRPNSNRPAGKFSPFKNKNNFKGRKPNRPN